MPKFRIEYEQQEVSTYRVTVEASSEEEAKLKVMEGYVNDTEYVHDVDVQWTQIKYVKPLEGEDL